MQIMHIRDNALSVPVVVMTAVVKGIELETLDSQIVKAIMRKPFDLQSLRNPIDTACRTEERSADHYLHRNSFVP